MRLKIIKQAHIKDGAALTKIICFGLKKNFKFKVNILYLPVTLIRIIKALNGNLKIKNNFLKTLEISCYSFTRLIKEALPYLNDNASLLTLSYYGAEKVIPHYNVMGVAKAALESSVRYLASDLGEDGIRVNAISAGPMKTLAGAAIGGARRVFRLSEQKFSP